MDTAPLLTTVLSIHITYPQSAADVGELLRTIGELWPSATIDTDGAVVVPAVR